MKIIELPSHRLWDSIAFGSMALESGASPQECRAQCRAPWIRLCSLRRVPQLQDSIFVPILGSLGHRNVAFGCRLPETQVCCVFLPDSLPPCVAHEWCDAELNPQGWPARECGTRNHACPRTRHALRGKWHDRLQIVTCMQIKHRCAYMYDLFKFAAHASAPFAPRDVDCDGACGYDSSTVSLKRSKPPPRSCITFPYTPPKFGKGLRKLAFSSSQPPHYYQRLPLPQLSKIKVIIIIGYYLISTKL